MNDATRFIEDGSMLLDGFLSGLDDDEGRAFANLMFDLQRLLRDHPDLLDAGAGPGARIAGEYAVLVRRAGRLRLGHLGLAAAPEHRTLESGDDSKDFLDWAKDRVEQGRQDVADADGPVEKAEAVWDTVRDIANEGMDRLDRMINGPDEPSDP
jgi:hypothetical protein